MTFSCGVTMETTQTWAVTPGLCLHTQTYGHVYIPTYNSQAFFCCLICVSNKIVCCWCVALLFFNTVGTFNPTTGILLLWQQLELGCWLIVKFHKYAKHQVVLTTFVTLFSPMMMKRAVSWQGLFQSFGHFVLLQDRQIATRFSSSSLFLYQSVGHAGVL